MSTELLHGKDCVLEIAPDVAGVPGTYELIDLATDVTMNREKGESDGTNRESAASGYEATIPGLKKFSVEFAAHKEATGETPSAGMALLRTAWADDSTVHVKVTHGNEQTLAACKVGGGNMSQPLREVVTESFKLTNFGAVTDQATP